MVTSGALIVEDRGMNEAAPASGHDTTSAKDESEQWLIDRRLAGVVWAALSIAFLGYMLLGSLEIRLWDFGRLTFPRRGIRYVWSYFGSRMPDLPEAGLMQGMLAAACVVFLVMVVLALWLVLAPERDDLDHRTTASDSSST